LAQEPVFHGVGGGRAASGRVSGGDPVGTVAEDLSLPLLAVAERAGGEVV